MSRIDNITSALSLRIIHGHLVRHGRDWQEQKIKENYTLWSITKGRVWITTDGSTFTAEKGDAVLFYPGRSYSAHTDGEGCEFIFVFFSLEMGNGLDLFAGENVEGMIGNKEIQRQSKLFRRAFLSVSSGTQHFSLKVYSAFLEYLCCMIQEMRGAEARHFTAHARVQEPPSIRLTLDYIGAHYTDNFTVSQLADLAGLSEKRFISNFKNTVGLSPGQYRNQLRMRKAAELVGGTDKKISEIAQILGYADQYTFSKAFRRAFGESPSDFRESVVL